MLPEKDRLSASKKRNTVKATVFRGCLQHIVLVIVFLVLWWKVIKFPPQIFGTPEDHFRAHVIRPIPKSVTNLKVAFDDLLIHPDVMYLFRFSINREDLEKILVARSLLPNPETSCSVSYPPEWWDVTSHAVVEIYQYHRPGGIVITLCYVAARAEAYYSFFTY